MDSGVINSGLKERIEVSTGRMVEMTNNKYYLGNSNIMA